MAAHPVRVPRVNANDDVVQVLRLSVASADKVAAGQLLAEIETDKATVEVAAEQAGYVLRINAEAGSSAPVGSVLLWLGDTPDEAVPDEAALNAPHGVSTEATAKARKLLALYGLAADSVKAAGARLTAEDVERHAREHSLVPRSDVGEERAPATPPLNPGRAQALNATQRAMARAVQWHKTVPVTAYLESPFDHAAWRGYADVFASSHRSLFDPLLALITFRLVAAARDVPQINATMLDEGLYLYDSVNVGFTIQTESGLVMAVVRDAQKMDEATFVKALHGLQRQALGKRLTPESTTGTTVAFTSLASAGVLRHIPVLPAQTGLIIAHSATQSDGKSIVGATYDHRFLDGSIVAQVLTKLGAP